ncbi:MAG: NAD-dependent epimerase/dehydratase family protein [Bdellovibrio sp.]|nr:NAD-dependent epimerase/dehydratase family protein [Bdellovibrio sp.]
MKILVIGGTRYFGKRLVHLLLKQGHELWVLSRGQVEDDFGASVHRLKADRSHKEALLQATSGLEFDVVMDQVCMNATQAALACEVFAQKTKHYVMTSTLSVYPLGADLKEKEVDPLQYQPKPATNPAEEYAEGKRAAENHFATKAPFTWAFARFPVVVGEDDYTLRLHNQVKRVLEAKGIYYPNLNAQFSFITSEDAAKALFWLIENRKQGAYNFASEDAISLRKLIEEIELVTGKKASLLERPDQEAWSPFGIPEDWYMNTEKAQSEGFTCQPLREWLRPLLKKISDGI